MIALNVLYDNNENLNHAYVSKHKTKRGKPVILLMIANGGWNYLAVKKHLH